LRYVCYVTRQPDTQKKPALLEKIVDHLVDRPLSTLTFRGLATALDVSTFTLVYHFGTRAELVRDIIESIARRQRRFEMPVDLGDVTIDSYSDGLKETFENALLPQNRALQRLEFEAQMLEALETEHGVTRTVHEELQNRGRSALVALGLRNVDADIESRLLIDTFYGIQVGLVVNRDDERARAAYERAIEHHLERVVALAATAGAA
jgi:AcrR family transcriptional regulator